MAEVEAITQQFGLMWCRTDEMTAKLERKRKTRLGTDNTINKPIPLRSSDVQVTIDKNFNQTVTVRLVYRNDMKETVQVKYVLPLAMNTAVTSFETSFDGGATVRAVIQESKQAKATYDKAVEDKKNASLMTQNKSGKSDIFTMLLGNFEPNQTCVVTFTLVGELPMDGSANNVRFTLPMCVAPVYETAAEPTSGLALDDEDKDVDMVDATAASASSSAGTAAKKQPARLASSETPYKLTFVADVYAADKLKSITSPTHEISVSDKVISKSNCSRVTLDSKTTSLNKDLVLLLAREDPCAPSATIEYDGQRKSIAVQLAVTQPASPVDVESEFVFLVDTSGSMDDHASTMPAVKNTLHLCLRALPAEARFNIVSFSSSFTGLFITASRIESRANNDDTLSAATSFIDGLHAGGGTELLAPLKAILEAPIKGKYLRQVFVLTDGEVDNDDALATLVRTHATTARVFTFGMGLNVSHHLVHALARAGNGEPVFIANVTDGDLEDKAMRQMKRAMQPALLDVKVDLTPILKHLAGGSSSKSDSKSTRSSASVEGKADGKSSPKKDKGVMASVSSFFASLSSNKSNAVVGTGGSESKQQDSGADGTTISILPRNLFAGTRSFVYAVVPGVERDAFAALCKSLQGSKDALTINMTSTSLLPGDKKLYQEIAFAIDAGGVTIAPETGGQANLSVLHGLAARRYIEQLEFDHVVAVKRVADMDKKLRNCSSRSDEGLALAADKAAQQKVATALEQKIVKLSIEFGVVSKFASFVAVHETKQVASKQTSTVEIPLAQPGWAPPEPALAFGSRGGPSAHAMASACPMPASAAASCYSGPARAPAKAAAACGGGAVRSRSGKFVLESAVVRGGLTLEDSEEEEKEEGADFDEDGDSDMEAAAAPKPKSKGRKTIKKGAAVSRALESKVSAATVAPKSSFLVGDALCSAIVKLQKSNGSWRLDKELTNLIDFKKLTPVFKPSFAADAGSDPIAAIDARCKSLIQLVTPDTYKIAPGTDIAGTIDAESIIGTVLALMVLKTLLPDKAARWEISGAKADRWLTKQGAIGIAARVVVEVRNLLGLDRVAGSVKDAACVRVGASSSGSAAAASS